MRSLVKVKEATVITPSDQTPSTILSLSALDSQLFLRFTIEYLLSALSRALVPYFPFSGRVRERPDGGSGGSLEVNSRGQGALFLEDLDFQKPSWHVTVWRKLLSLNIVDVLAGAPPLVVQLTWLRYDRAGITHGSACVCSVHRKSLEDLQQKILHLSRKPPSGLICMSSV
ncbi:hypothetical protein Bca101_082621 [Brassica carinata]